MSGTQNKNMSVKFDALVKSLDQGSLETLRRSVVLEIKGRGERTETSHGEPSQDDAIHIGSIRPGMSAQDKERAAQEIARVLREGS